MPSRDLHRIPWLPVVRQRFQTVEDSAVRYLKSRKDPEAMHDMRVACRRAEATLRLSRDVAHRRSCQWLRKRLSNLRRSCNEARDDDVLLKWLKQQSDPDGTRPLQRVIARHRRDLMPQIVKQSQALIRDESSDKHTQKLLKSLGKAEQAQQTPAALGKRLFAGAREE